MSQIFVIHPLDDVPEIKVNVDTLGPMTMGLPTRVSLLALRGYLLFVVCVATAHLVALAL